MIFTDKAMIRRALAIAWPLILSELANSVTSIIVLYVLSSLGDVVVASVGLAQYVFMILYSLSQMALVGTLVLISQLYGAGRLEDSSRVLSEALPLFTLLGAIIAVGMFPASKAIMMVVSGSTNEEFIDVAVKYFTIRLIEIPVFMASSVYGAAFRAVGITIPVMVSTLISSALNVFTSWLLVSIGMGIESVAWASVASVAASFAVYVAFSKALPFRLRLALPRRYALRLLDLGVPASLERLLFSAGNVAYVGSVSRCGLDSMAAHTIGVRVESFVYMPSIGLSVATSSLVGQLVGSGEIGSAKRLGLELAKLNALMMAAAGALLAAVSFRAPKFFTPTQSVASLATMYLLVAALGEVPFGLASGLSSAIRGAGNTWVPLTINALNLFALRVLPSFQITKLMPAGLCPLGAWVSMDLDLVGRALSFYIIYVRFFERMAKRRI